jgi:hypothetical protein
LAFLGLAGCGAVNTGLIVSANAQYLGGSLFVEPVDEDGGFLVLDGPITPETSYRFQSLVESYDVRGLVIAQSPGGDLLASHQIGDAIRSNGINTTVLAVCYSACVDVFIAGRNREMDREAELGLHVASDREFGYEVDSVYWRRMGFEAVNEAVYNMPEGGVWFVDAKRARELRMATAIIQ